MARAGASPLNLFGTLNLRPGTQKTGPDSRSGSLFGGSGRGKGKDERTVREVSCMKGV